MKRYRGGRAVIAAASLLASAGVFAVASITYAEGHLGSAKKSRPCSTSTPCLTERNTGSGGGVLAQSTSGNALEGDATTGQGVYGSSTGTASATVGSNSSTGNGIYGYSSSGDGVQGQSHAGVAVDAYSAENDGVYGATGGAAAGVYGYSNSPHSVGVEALVGANAGTSLYVVGGTTGTGALDVIEAINSNDSGGFSVDDEGHAYATGGFVEVVKCRQGCSNARRIISYSAQTSMPTLDDVGEATLHNGGANVALDPAFANVIDQKKPYVVLLTPEGNAGLYVASRTPTAFEVREVGGGHATVSFAYRIVAKPYGAADGRLPLRTDLALPRP